MIRNRLNKNRHWTYFSLVNDKEKGTIVDFILKRGFSYKAIRVLNSMHLDDTVIKNQFSLENELKELSIQEQLAKVYFYSFESNITSNYLKARGIAASTYRPYIGTSLQVDKKVV
ncbi:Plasmid recombination enzyme [Cardinium endosymbiont of Sogatella furcifera]|uniref:hypothetical protein n=1 Tax=Cardinium endosymbiont of Sogatella furcifera TaxID=650378 RepID=UPI000E109997|nr:hypothetical protein [Cardinium endosymbiont of Sogatella furcifera]AXI23965.1 Plasmid recombination enzyme [Cardinium endosymbiont of Sogatella furcifera]